MTVETFVVQKLKAYGVTDAFGIPGGVILKLIREMQQHAPELTPHLCYHEQSAGFAACGYAQAKGCLGVAYATRGPGIMNMFTCIAEAYQESLPVLFITAHGNRTVSKTRFDQNQEMDIVSSVSGFTKYAENIDTIEEVAEKLEKACYFATTGRKGPVLLDFSTSLWEKELDDSFDLMETPENVTSIDEITTLLCNTKRPILLVGDGLRHSLESEKMHSLVEKLKIPVLSSRGSQDLLSGSPMFFGYVGSHGVRYSNFILSKADAIISLGNRLAFPLQSASFAPILQDAEIVRVDIDATELTRIIPGAHSFCMDAGQVLAELAHSKFLPDWEDWLAVCRELKTTLLDVDCTEPVKQLIVWMDAQPENTVYVSDVGNNEFWFSRAFERINRKGTVLCSKSFGTLGTAIGKSIGAYYALHRPIVCVMGDQGFQFHVQELQYIAKHRLPIQIVVLNNRASGMILDHEMNLHFDEEVHVTEKSDYYVPDLKAIAESYGFKYHDCRQTDAKNHLGTNIYEISVPPLMLTPNLPKGNPCQEMEPLLDRDLFKMLNEK